MATVNCKNPKPEIQIEIIERQIYFVMKINKNNKKKVSPC